MKLIYYWLNKKEVKDAEDKAKFQVAVDRIKNDNEKPGTVARSSGYLEKEVHILVKVKRKYLVYLSVSFFLIQLKD